LRAGSGISLRIKKEGLLTAQSSGNKFLRVLGIILLSLAVLMTLLGGIGTTCVAFAAEKFGGSMAKLAPVKPIFQALVVISIAAGIFGLLATIRLARGRRGVINQLLAFLVVAGAASAVQYYYSLTLRGSTAPNNVRLYVTVLALVAMLIYRLPGMWDKVGYERAGGSGKGAGLAGGAALCLCGAITLTTPLWAGPTHMVDGFNTVEVLGWQLLVLGSAQLLGGIGLLIAPLVRRGEVVAKVESI